MKPEFILTPGQLTFADVASLQQVAHRITLNPDCFPAIAASENTVKQILASGQSVYGINTGFGQLANQRISSEQLVELQQNLILSHAVGVGGWIADDVVKLILLLKINNLAQGFSGVSLAVINALTALYNAEVYPCIPSKGSVGASGDLAPLAHMSACLLGHGQVKHQGNVLSAKEGLAVAGLQPLSLQPKEGLALLNGLQVSTALAVTSLLRTQQLFASAVIIGALTVEAAAGSHVPFDERIHQVRRHSAQEFCAGLYRELLEGSGINESHENCGRVQDPYSLRCQPQVMGACYQQLAQAEGVLATEMNAVSDNPLVFADSQEILSGGNFHGEIVAMAADNLALCIAEIGSLAERRIALLIDHNFSGLPPFLVRDGGVNSGFMIAQVTAAALASENKSLSHPASVDSLPTSANQEDHVSMATFAARRLHEMLDNTFTILAIELLAAAQGIDFRRPLKTSARLEEVIAAVRKQVAFYEKDRFFAPDIECITKWLEAEECSRFTKRLMDCEWLFATLKPTRDS